MSATLKQSHLYLFSPPAPKSTKGTLLIFSPNPSAPDSLNPLRPKSQLTRSPGRGRPRIDSGPPGSSRRPHRGPGWRRVQKVTGGDRGRQGRAAPYRAAPRRRRKLFPARKLPGSAAADGLPSRLRERGGAPSPGGGQAGREGAGRGERRSNRGRGSAGARTLRRAGPEPGRIVSAASDPAPAAAAAQAGAAGSCRPESAAPFRRRRSPRSLCVSRRPRVASQLAWQLMGSSRWVPRLPRRRQRSPARPKEEDWGRALTDAVLERPPPGGIWDCPRGGRRPTRVPLYPFETPSALGPSRPPSHRRQPSSSQAPSALLRSWARSVKNPGEPAPPPGSLTLQWSWPTGGSSVQSSVGKPGQSPRV